MSLKYKKDIFNLQFQVESNIVTRLTKMRSSPLNIVGYLSAWHKRKKVLS